MNEETVYDSTGEREIGYDADGFKILEVEGYRMRLTKCCEEATTGTDDAIVCKGCYEVADPEVEFEPREPITCACSKFCRERIT